MITSNGHQIITATHLLKSVQISLSDLLIWSIYLNYNLNFWSAIMWLDLVSSCFEFSRLWIFPTSFSRFSHTANGSLVRNSLTCLKIPGTSDAHQVARAVIRLNRAVTAFFVARYCASWSRQTRALNRDVYLKAHEMARLSLCVIICEDVSVPVDSSDSGIWFLRIPREMLIICRGVAALNDRKLISLSITQLYIMVTEKTILRDASMRRANRESVRSSGTIPWLTSIISLLTIMRERTRVCCLNL